MSPTAAPLAIVDSALADEDGRNASMRIARRGARRRCRAAARGGGDAEHGETALSGLSGLPFARQERRRPAPSRRLRTQGGVDADYAYSDALKQSGIVWDEATLDKWLTDPQAFVPGAKMFYHLADPADRADVIAFLKERARDGADGRLAGAHDQRKGQRRFRDIVAAASRRRLSRSPNGWPAKAPTPRTSCRRRPFARSPRWSAPLSSARARGA